MRRRDVIALLGAAAAVWPLATRARSDSKPVRIGILMSEPSRPLDSLRDEMRRLGYVEGKTLVFEQRFASGSEQRYPALAAELVGLGVDVIVTWGTPATLSAKRATATIPIVMAAVGDPISTGIVSSFAQPGGNVTGFSTVNAELEDKRLDLLKELVPHLARVGVLSNANSAYAALAVKRLRATGEAMGLTVDVAEATDRADVDDKLRGLIRSRPGAVVVVADSFLTSQHGRIIRLIAESRLPAIYAYRETVEAGGFMAYAADYDDLFRRAAGYVDKILKGGSPASLPIQQATRFELIINLRTAKALDIAVPDALLGRADEIIE